MANGHSHRSLGRSPRIGCRINRSTLKALLTISVVKHAFSVMWDRRLPAWGCAALPLTPGYGEQRRWRCTVGE